MLYLLAPFEVHAQLIVTLFVYLTWQS